MVRLRVKELVEQRGLTWQRFTDDTGLSKQTVYALLSGNMTRIDFKTLGILCMYFDVSPGEILTFKPADAPVTTD